MATTETLSHFPPLPGQDQISDILTAPSACAMTQFSGENSQTAAAAGFLVGAFSLVAAIEFSFREHSLMKRLKELDPQSKAHARRAHKLAKEAHRITIDADRQQRT